jgi:hypothetical protein
LFNRLQRRITISRAFWLGGGKGPASMALFYKG